MNRNLDSCPSFVVIINVVVAVESVEMVVAVSLAVAVAVAAMAVAVPVAVPAMPVPVVPVPVLLRCAFHWAPGYPAYLLQAVVCPQLPSFLGCLCGIIRHLK